jgi:hypothetical protein
MGNKQQETGTDAADQAGIRLEAGASAQAKSLAEEFARLKTGWPLSSESSRDACLLC